MDNQIFLHIKELFLNGFSRVELIKAGYNYRLVDLAIKELTIGIQLNKQELKPIIA